MSDNETDNGHDPDASSPREMDAAHDPSASVDPSSAPPEGSSSGADSDVDAPAHGDPARAEDADTGDGPENEGAGGEDPAASDEPDPSEMLEQLKRQFDAAVSEGSNVDLSALTSPQVQTMGAELLGQVMSALTSTVRTAVETAKLDDPELIADLETSARDAMGIDAYQERAADALPDDDADAPPRDGDEADEEASEDGAEVIDLSEVRAQREQEVQSNFKLPFNIADNLRDAVQEYLYDHVVDEEADTVDVRVDQDFLRHHGPGLLANVLKSVAQSLVRGEQVAEEAEGEVDADADAPTVVPLRAVEDPEDGVQLAGDDAPAEADAALASDDEARAEFEASAESAADVSGEGAGQADAGDAPADEDSPDEEAGPRITINVDLGSLIAGLFGRRSPPEKT